MAALSLGALLMPIDVSAGSSSASLTVTLTIRAYANLKVLLQPALWEITAADIKRGYIDFPVVSRFVVSTNSHLGYAIDFLSLSDLFKSVQIKTQNGIIQLGPDGGVVYQRVGPLSNMPIELSYHFILHSDAHPGSYQWPLRQTVRPIEFGAEVSHMAVSLPD